MTMGRRIFSTHIYTAAQKPFLPYTFHIYYFAYGIRDDGKTRSGNGIARRAVNNVMAFNLPGTKVKQINVSETDSRKSFMNIIHLFHL